MPSKLPQFILRFNETQLASVKQSAQKHGYTSENEYLRDVLAGKAPLPSGFVNDVQRRGKYPRKTQK